MSRLPCVPFAVLALWACDPMNPSEPGNLVPLTVAEDASLPAIDLNGSRFHLETAGDPTKPVIIFLHGGPGGDYRGMLPLAARFDGQALTDDYFLVFWDQRGAGLSKRHDRNQLTLEIYESDLDAVVNRFSPGRPVYLIGVSWGGMYATQYINAHPEKVAGAVLIEPGPLTGATYERLEDDLEDIDLGAEWLNDVAWSSQFLSPDDHARMDYERLLGLRHSQPKSHIDWRNPEAMWRLGAAVSRYLKEDGEDAGGRAVYDFTNNLYRYATPVLFIAGSRSEILGPTLQQEQMLEYPSASLAIVDDAGHDVAWIKTREVLTHVRAYLSARQGGSND